MTYCFEDIRVWSRGILLNFCWVSIFQHYILIANISWMVAQTPKNYIFWENVIITYRCIYVNWFSRLRFLAEVSTKLKKKKKHFLDNLRTISQEGNMENRQLTSFFFHLIFQLCKIHFWIWKLSKFIFMWSPLWSILVSKIPQFGSKATDSDSPSYFSTK